ncbi:mucin-2-like [Girardinichthys multiradiatus]|uniref:mucin-2-like n=1 Tax=Girardinichthys multiradiatus TaxID=208333 RepID=UPI001FACA89E|nr:mucin-2-like [Girardinichthys multiradiatus]
MRLRSVLWSFLALSVASLPEVQVRLVRNHVSSICSTWGREHFKTFDGDVYQFPGMCEYNLVSDCHESYQGFSVHIKRTEKDGIPTITYLAVTINELLFHLSKSWVTVNYEQVRLPYYKGGVQVENNAVYIKLQTKLGFTVMWNGDDAVMVEIDNDFANQTCGLCGDFNGVPVYNEFIHNGRKISPIEFGNKHKTLRPNDDCEDPYEEEEELLEAVTDSDSCKESLTICKQMFLSESWSSCTELIDPEAYIQACVKDMCGCSNNTNDFCVCSTLSEYSRQCSHAGGQPPNWRTPQFCAKQCPYNMVYEESGSPCMDTCTNQDTSSLCEDHKMDGCFCPSGTVLDDISERGCIPQSECQCKHVKIYNSGEVYLRDREECTCFEGRWDCISLETLATCAVEEGSHFTTFDGKTYTFHGDCYYTLAKDEASPTFTLLAQLVPCAHQQFDTCMKALKILLNNDKNNVLTFTSDGAIKQNMQTVTLPYNSGDISIFHASSFHILMQTRFGLQIQIQHVPLMQVYIRLEQSYKSKTRGLCGNFNMILSDEMKTPQGIVEGTAATFSNSWKANLMCSDRQERLDDPCSLSLESELYAKHWCALLLSPNSTFAQCRSVVDPEMFYKRCTYSACSCEKSEACLCAVFSSYARACAEKGVFLTNLRESVCDTYTKSCPASQTFSYAHQRCQLTCRSLGSEEQSCTSDFLPVDGCSCAEGLYLNENGLCVPLEKCSCYHNGIYINPGKSINIRDEHCLCNSGVLHCHSWRSRSSLCPFPKAFFNCSSATTGELGLQCAKTCLNLDSNECDSTECESGCRCQDGLLEDGKGSCVKEIDCPCQHNGHFFAPGVVIPNQCNKCTCKSGKWECTEKKCPGTCVIYGSGHYNTFDQRTYGFQGDCAYVAVKNKCGNKTVENNFGVITENVPCGSTGTTCSKTVRIQLGRTEIKLTKGKYEEDDLRQGPLIKYRIRRVGLYLVVESTIGLAVIWDRKTSVRILLEPQHSGEVCGLCGNFDGDGRNDFTTQGQLVVSNMLEFANSWKVSSTCPDVEENVDSCAVAPMRHHWAKMMCSIITGHTFKDCQHKVDPRPFYENCVKDSCACDTGGDCECFCSAVAAYAQACNEAGVCVAWRTPDICPVFCEYYNSPDDCTWHYSPCHTPCYKTCLNPQGICSNPLPNLEGCYPVCPEDKPIFDEKNQTCVEECAYCLYNGTIYEENDVVYNVTDYMGMCYYGICINSTVIHISKPCTTTPEPSTTTTAPPTTTTGPSTTTKSTPPPPPPPTTTTPEPPTTTISPPSTRTPTTTSETIHNHNSSPYNNPRTIHNHNSSPYNNHRAIHNHKIYPSTYTSPNNNNPRTTHNHKSYTSPNNNNPRTTHNHNSSPYNNHRAIHNHKIYPSTYTSPNNNNPRTIHNHNSSPYNNHRAIHNHKIYPSTSTSPNNNNPRTTHNHKSYTSPNNNNPRTIHNHNSSPSPYNNPRAIHNHKIYPSTSTYPNNNNPRTTHNHKSYTSPNNNNPTTTHNHNSSPYNNHRAIHNHKIYPSTYTSPNNNNPRTIHNHNSSPYNNHRAIHNHKIYPSTSTSPNNNNPRTTHNHNITAIYTTPYNNFRVIHNHKRYFSNYHNFGHNYLHSNLTIHNHNSSPYNNPRAIHNHKIYPSTYTSPYNNNPRTIHNHNSSPYNNHRAIHNHKIYPSTSTSPNNNNPRTTHNHKSYTSPNNNNPTTTHNHNSSPYNNHRAIHNHKIYPSTYTSPNNNNPRTIHNHNSSPYNNHRAIHNHKIYPSTSTSPNNNNPRTTHNHKSYTSPNNNNPRTIHNHNSSPYNNHRAIHNHKIYPSTSTSPNNNNPRTTYNHKSYTSPNNNNPRTIHNHNSSPYNNHRAIHNHKIYPSTYTSPNNNNPRTTHNHKSYTSPNNNNPTTTHNHNSSPSHYINNPRTTHNHKSYNSTYTSPYNNPRAIHNHKIYPFTYTSPNNNNPRTTHNHKSYNSTYTSPNNNPRAIHNHKKPSTTTKSTPPPPPPPTTTTPEPPTTTKATTPPTHPPTTTPEPSTTTKSTPPPTPPPTTTTPEPSTTTTAPPPPTTTPGTSTTTKSTPLPTPPPTTTTPELSPTTKATTPSTPSPTTTPKPTTTTKVSTPFPIPTTGPTRSTVPPQEQVSHTVTTECFCIFNGTIYHPGQPIFSMHPIGSGICLTMICSDVCEIHNKTELCASTSASTLTPSPTPYIPTCPEWDVVQNETFVICNCTMARCIENNTIEIIPLECPPLQNITCSNGKKPVLAYDEYYCCQKYVCDCVCEGWGDPHYITFDGLYYSYQGNCTYVLMEEYTPKNHLKIYVDNVYCDPTEDVSCPRALTIAYGFHVVTLINHNLIGAPQLEALKNEEILKLPYSQQGVKIMSSAINLVYEIPRLNVVITFGMTGFSINLPYQYFGNNTQGHCGTCNNNMADDCRLPTGELVKNCAVMADYWPADDVIKPNCPTPPVVPTNVPESQLEPTPCKPDSICDLLKRSVFAECHPLVSPDNFYKGCAFDSCHVSNPTVECTSLQTYAAACAQAGICIQWRNHTKICASDCPSDKVYMPCGPAEQPSCEDNPNESTTQFITEGCFCPDGMKLFNKDSGICVEKCGCLDPEGIPREFNERFEYKCQDCICDESTKTVICKPKTCPEPPSANCTGPGFVVVNQTNPVDPCCFVYVCQCQLNNCPQNSMSCPIGYRPIISVPEGKCCPEHTCDPKRVCVHKNVEYEPSSSVPAVACQDCTCGNEIDPHSGLFKLDCVYQQCHETCDLGYEYVETNSNDCCGKCVQKQCILNLNGTKQLLNEGEMWSPPENMCEHYTCMRNGDTLSALSSQIICPHFQESNCHPNTIQTAANGCCKICMEIDKACKLISMKTLVLRHGCQSEHEVEMPYCEGSCNTFTKYSAAAAAMEHSCSCCKEIRSSNRTIDLLCLNGGKITHTYMYVEECGCGHTECTATAGLRARKKRSSMLL